MEGASRCEEHPTPRRVADVYEQIGRNKRRAVFYTGVFFAMWVGIGALLGWLATALATAPGAPASRAPIVVGAVIAGVLALGAVAFAWNGGAGLVLRVARAHPADPVAYQELHNIVEALAIGSGLPKPQVYVVDDPSPNAFATGTSPDRAAVTVTTGLLELMNRAELEGVVAHELSHIKNYDVRLILVVSTLIGLAGLMASLIWRGVFHLRLRGKGGVQVLVIVLVAGVLLTIIAFVVGPLIKLALSRRRESLADASGVELTRNPVGLIAALRKLEANDQALTNYNHATAAMCIEDPVQYHSGFFAGLFNTHPPLSERIAALERIAQVREL